MCMYIGKNISPSLMTIPMKQPLVPPSLDTAYVGSKWHGRGFAPKQPSFMDAHLRTNLPHTYTKIGSIRRKFRN